MISIYAVSYTHLDVYKRQIHNVLTIIVIISFKRSNIYNFNCLVVNFFCKVLNVIWSELWPDTNDRESFHGTNLFLHHRDWSPVLRRKDDPKRSYSDEVDRVIPRGWKRADSELTKRAEWRAKWYYQVFI